MIPYKETSEVTFRATAAVVGKRMLAISGDRTGGPGLSADLENVYRMAHCAAGAKAFGVSKSDVAINKLGGCDGSPGRIVPVTAGGAIVAGNEVQSDAVGKVVALTTGKAVGLAMTGAAGDNTTGEIKLF
jgi:hypothetical protein